MQNKSRNARRELAHIRTFPGFGLYGDSRDRANTFARCMAKLLFFLDLTPIFYFLVSEIHCHFIQLCDLVFNPCSVVQMVIHFHSYIKMSVSHDVLQNFHIHMALRHSSAGYMTHNVSGNFWKHLYLPVFSLLDNLK